MRSRKYSRRRTSRRTARRRISRRASRRAAHRRASRRTARRRVNRKRYSNQMRGGMRRYYASTVPTPVGTSRVDTQANPRELVVGQTYELIANTKGMIGFGDTEYPRPGPKVNVSSQVGELYNCEIVERGAEGGLVLGEVGDTIEIKVRQKRLRSWGLKKYPFKISIKTGDGDKVIYIRVLIPNDSDYLSEAEAVAAQAPRLETGKYYTLKTSSSRKEQAQESNKITVKVTEVVDEVNGIYHFIMIDPGLTYVKGFNLMKRMPPKENVDKYPYKYTYKHWRSGKMVNVYVETPEQLDDATGAGMEKLMNENIQRERQQAAQEQAQQNQGEPYYGDPFLFIT